MRYPSQPTTNQGNIIGSRMANEIEHRFQGAMRILSRDDQRDSSIAELLAASSDFLNVMSYGAIGDGTHDDTEAIQAAFDAAADGDVVYFPDGLWRISTQLTASNITIQGSGQYTCQIICIGCSGIEVVIGTVASSSLNRNFKMFDIDVAQAVRHTDTPNTLIGIQVSGDTTFRPFNHVYRNVYVDGFETAFRSDWMWASVFDNFRSGFGAIGIHARHLSANNIVTNCTLLGDAAVDSRGIWLEGKPTASEGWLIKGNVLDAFEVCILGEGVTHVKVVNNILDHIVVDGIAINDDADDDFGGNWTIAGNYIAMNGSAGNAAISCNNTVANSSNRGNQIYGNHVLVYATKVCAKGIWMAGTEAKNNTIFGNTLQGFSANDILCLSGKLNIVMGNTCLSAVTNNIGSPDVAIGNRGTISGFPILTFTAADATPTIKVDDVLAPLCLSGGAVTITDFDDGRQGDEFTLLAAHAVTVTDGSNMLLEGSRNYVMAAGDTLTLAMINDGIWEEVSRKVNLDAAGNFTDVTYTGRVLASTVTTLANDATPTVAAGNIFKTGGTTTITDFDDGVVGQTIKILSAHAVTITDGTNMMLNGSANFVMAADDTLTLTMYNDQVWNEDSRQVN